MKALQLNVNRPLAGGTGYILTSYNMGGGCPCTDCTVDPPIDRQTDTTEKTTFASPLAGGNY